MAAEKKLSSGVIFKSSGIPDVPVLKNCSVESLQYHVLNNVNRSGDVVDNASHKFMEMMGLLFFWGGGKSW